jgi:hypothetical protein
MRRLLCKFRLAYIPCRPVQMAQSVHAVSSSRRITNPHLPDHTAPNSGSRRLATSHRRVVASLCLNAASRVPFRCRTAVVMCAQNRSCWPRRPAASRLRRRSGRAHECALAFRAVVDHNDVSSHLGFIFSTAPASLTLASACRISLVSMLLRGACTGVIARRLYGCVRVGRVARASQRARERRSYSL